MKKLFGAFFGLFSVVFRLILLFSILIIGTDLISRYFEDKHSSSEGE